MAGCSYHLAHMTSQKGGSAYGQITGFNMEERQVDLYYILQGVQNERTCLWMA